MQATTTFDSLIDVATLRAAPTQDNPTGKPTRGWAIACGDYADEGEPDVYAEITVAERPKDVACLIVDAIRTAHAAGPVLSEVSAERRRQDAKWGPQNHPDGTGGPLTRSDANQARRACQQAAADNATTWAHILTEEVCEALAETDPSQLRTELVQIAAVAVAWIQAIDRRTPTS